MRSIRRRLSTGGTLLAAILIAGFSAARGSAQETVSLSVAIYPASCVALEGEPVYELEPAVREEGRGARALPGVSESTIDVSLDQLQASQHAIVVSRSGELAGLLACGEINSVAMADGSVAIGLREQVGSTYAGIAILTPNGAQTTIRAFVAGGLLDGMIARGSGNANAPIDETVTVIITDDGIEADQTTFSVGNRVEFTVTNEGTESHEVMLERPGADEEPLGDADEQAETEDLAVGATVSFVYTFEEAGDFQLADHIGSNDLVLEITVE